MTPLDDFSIAKHTALTERIQHTMLQAGKITFATFMELALYCPELGYYQSPQMEIGSQGDFTTAPEISPLFAQCFVPQWQTLLNHLGTGSILELGAGTGRFASDLLRKLTADNTLPDHYYIYEISMSLREKQQALLKNTCPHFWQRIIWLDCLPTDFVGLIIANEVLDALPVHCFEIVEHHIIRERYVAWDKDHFIWQLGEPSTQEFTEKIQSLQTLDAFSPGYQSEINLYLSSWLLSWIRAIKQGVLLLVDYGYGQEEYYHPERRQGTLTCFYRHQKHSNPLLLPGLQDITTHVNFTQVAEIACDAGCSLLGYTSQAAFLLASGILENAAELEQNLTPTDAFLLHQSIKTLTMPTEMGERVKVMALAKNVDLSFTSFTLQDRRRDL